MIRTCRESTGLDRAAFAADVGVPEHILALWEDPTYEGVDLAILRRVARAAGGELELCFRPMRIRPSGWTSNEGADGGTHDWRGAQGRERA